MFDGTVFADNPKPEPLILRPIQAEMLNRVREAFGKHKRVILQAATAAGKTAISAKIIQRCVKNGKRVLFLADRIVLINQTSAEFYRWGISHGIIQAENPLYDPTNAVQIGSTATLVNREVGKFDMIIQDEAHIISKGAKKAFDSNPDAYVLGLSASPYSKSLGKIYETHIQPFTVKQLIDKGLLCPYEAYGPAQIDLSSVTVAAGEYNNKSLGEAVDKPKLTADIVQTYLKLAKNKKSIVFSVNVAHSRALEKEFNRHGIPAKEINAYLPKEGAESAKQIIEGFRNNKFKVLISVQMATTGFDVPDVEVVVFATATKSMIKFTQALGRGLRLSPGKEKCLVLDHGSNFERLGYPDEYVFDELDDGKHQSSKNKKHDKPEKLPVVCKSCNFLKAPGVRICPACGFEAKYIQDVEVSPGELEKLKRKAKRDYSLEEKKAFLGGLNQYAENKGWKKSTRGIYGASIHRFKDKFGCLPSNKIQWDYKCPINDDVKKFIQHQNIKCIKSKEKTEMRPSVVGKKLNLKDPCMKCQNTMGVLSKAGPHMKLSCDKCGQYIKFVNLDELKRAS